MESSQLEFSQVAAAAATAAAAVAVTSSLSDKGAFCGQFGSDARAASSRGGGGSSNTDSAARQQGIARASPGPSEVSLQPPASPSKAVNPGASSPCAEGQIPGSSSPLRMVAGTETEVDGAECVLVDGEALVASAQELIEEQDEPHVHAVLTPPASPLRSVRTPTRAATPTTTAAATVGEPGVCSGAAVASTSSPSATLADGATLRPSLKPPTLLPPPPPPPPEEAPTSMEREAEQERLLQMANDQLQLANEARRVFKRSPSLPELHRFADERVGGGAAAHESEVYVELRPLKDLVKTIPLVNLGTQVLAEVGICHFLALVRRPDGHIYQLDFGPVGGEISLGGLQNTISLEEAQSIEILAQTEGGEVREEQYQGGIPESAYYIGRTSLSIEEIRAFAQIQDTSYTLNRNDCRHFVNSLVLYMTGIPNAVRFAVKEYVSLCTEDPGRPNVGDICRNIGTKFFDVDHGTAFRVALAATNTGLISTAISLPVARLVSSIGTPVGLAVGRLLSRFHQVPAVVAALNTAAQDNQAFAAISGILAKAADGERSRATINHILRLTSLPSSASPHGAAGGGSPSALAVGVADNIYNMYAALSQSLRSAGSPSKWVTSMTSVAAPMIGGLSQAMSAGRAAVSKVGEAVLVTVSTLTTHSNKAKHMATLGGSLSRNVLSSSYSKGAVSFGTRSGRQHARGRLTLQQHSFESLSQAQARARRLSFSQSSSRSSSNLVAAGMLDN